MFAKLNSYTNELFLSTFLTILHSNVIWHFEVRIPLEDYRKSAI